MSWIAVRSSMTQRLRFRLELLPRRAAAVEQRLPAGGGAPRRELLARRRRFLEIDEAVRHAALREPLARFLHRIAIGDAV